LDAYIERAQALKDLTKIDGRGQLATGRFTALGRRIDLSGVKLPIYLLLARDDHVVAPAQMLAVQRLVGTPPAAIRRAIAPCGHLTLFMGKSGIGSKGRSPAFLTPPSVRLVV